MRELQCNGMLNETQWEAASPPFFAVDSSRRGDLSPLESHPEVPQYRPRAPIIAHAVR